MPRPRTTSKLSESLHHRLNSYALAASAAGLGALAAAQPADARIVYRATHQSLIGIGDTISIDLNHDGIVDFKLLYTSAAKFYYLAVDPQNNLNAVMTVHSDKALFADPLNAGVHIGPGKNFNLGFQNLAYKLRNQHTFTTTFTSHGPWLGKANKYLGMKFVIDNEVHYGWARVSAAKKCCEATLTGYAYETIPNKPIIAGKTKGPDVITVEPGSLGHLARGASGLSAWRRTAGGNR